MDICNLYEDLKKYVGEDEEREEMFYEAPEGEVQIDIVREMLEEIMQRLS